MRKWMRWQGVAVAPWIVLIAWSGAVGQESKKDKKPPSALRAECDRPAATYKVKETAVFLFQSPTAGEAKYQLTEDGFVVVKEGKLKVAADQPYKVEGTLDKPGFLQLRVTVGDKSVLAAAAFDPTKIEPTAKMPADFDDFWDAGKKELAQVPMDPQLEDRSEKHSTDRVDCYPISLASVGGKRVHGWISVPKGKGPFPAILTVPGAGVYGIGPDIHHAKLGALSMNIIIHDLPVDEKPGFYQQQAAGPLKDYRDIGMSDKNKSYYRGVILGCVRALDYLTSRPDYNGKDLGVTGGSQGGALTLITAGVDLRVKLAAPNVAAMCDHSGKAHGRVSGWPHWLYRVTDKDKVKQVLETAAYFDAVNFARKFKGKSVHGVGFIDTACAPTTVYAAFNVCPDPKTMIDSPLMGHGTDPRWQKARDEFWKANMELKPPTP